MTKKWGIRALILFGMYALAMYFYIFHSESGGIPAAFKGTVADPSVFMSERELYLSEEYSKIRNYLFFVATPFEWLVYLFILTTGLSQAFERWITLQKKWVIFQNAIYVFLLSLITFIALFPLNYYRYYLSKYYEISTQSFNSWMRDNVIEFWVNFLIAVVIVTVLYWLININTKKWWLNAWLLMIPFSIFLMFIKPVVIDPLYNDFYPLTNKELETEILSLAKQANIPTEHVYEVNMAEKTNALNAYVTGIGSNARIVLWDTTLNRLSENEILFIMAHEMGHYVEKHIYFGIAGYLITMLVGLWLTAKLMPWVIAHFGGILKIQRINAVHSLPLFLLFSSFLLFASSPLSNYISRYQETRADLYAMELVADPDAAVSTFQELTKAGLSEVNPPILVKWFRYSHPPMLERINKVANEIGKEE
ncbi:M48 family metallopeptidase [Psychrobacillus sp. NPDC058041]|uniref:M48 family metallopeptidase n=1 Tax=Psychrobacillus sp. NPDC058041 TaxID=3346310 RepID=UPI0036D864ED